MNNPKSSDKDLVVQEFDNETLVYDLKSNTAYSLNETSASVWRMCDGKTSVREMRQRLSSQTNQPIADEIIWLALDSLKRNNLLEDEENFQIEFGGLSRRAVIKKVGLTSMIALPVISTFIAPQAANAASGFLALNAVCTSSSQCLSGNCQGGSNPSRCCVPGSTNNIPPNQAIGCDPGCTNADARVCCSGSVHVGADLAFCTSNGFPLGSSCYCN